MEKQEFTLPSDSLYRDDLLLFKVRHFPTTINNKFSFNYYINFKLYL